MSFLKALGQVALHGGKAVLGAFFGIIKKDVAVTPSVADDLLVLILQKVAEKELEANVVELTGEEKRDMVAAVIEQAILRSPLVKGKKIRDPQAFRAAVRTLVSGGADLLNSFEDGVDTQDHT